MPQQNDLSRSLIPFEQATTLVAVIATPSSSAAPATCSISSAAASVSAPKRETLVTVPRCPALCC